MQTWHYNGLGYRRRPTRTVHVGDVTVGGDHPIRVQSMTTPATTDTAASVAQIVRLVEAGCEIVRLTVPTSRDADSLPAIRAGLGRLGIRVPFVADIHFTPAAAMKAIEHVDKIRINPGNYADKKKFNIREYTDDQYTIELERIETVFAPLVERAKQLGVSMRIGTNHGSLSDRIMNRYGDTPEGMVESALEFVRICESRDYRELILSMKSSNPVVVLQAYRLLCERMAQHGMAYPIHLGVTEAGDGEDGRIKSAIGIGALLDEGIGDTVRVSLTEDPVHEIPVAQALVARYNRRLGQGANRPAPIELKSPVREARDPFNYARRESAPVTVGPHTLGGGGTVLVEVALQGGLSDAAALRAELDTQAGVRVPEETRAEIVSVEVRSKDELDALAVLRESIEMVAPRVALSARLQPEWILSENEAGMRRWLDAAHRLHLPFAAAPAAAELDGLRKLLGLASDTSKAVLVEAGAADGDMEAAVDLACRAAGLEPQGGLPSLALSLAPSASYSPLHAVRLLAARLAAAKMSTPLLLGDDASRRDSDVLLDGSAALGGLLCDGIGDAIRVDAGCADDSRRLAFSILQAARVRTTRTEFISCPSCGRTLFDLEETTARIKQRTSHLKGLKIAVMGCVVNGPGEMADADFGYVGWGEDKIALFVGKEMVERGIPTAEADERLVELIKQHGRWIDPAVPAAEQA